MEKRTDAIPDKLYFKIGEVSQLLGIPPYVLRFWETEFKRIKPKRTPSGQRLYRKNDVELLQEIRHLLYEKRFTIPGAKQRLNDRKLSSEKHSQKIPISTQEILETLKAIKALLE